MAEPVATRRGHQDLAIPDGPPEEYSQTVIAQVFGHRVTLTAMVNPATDPNGALAMAYMRKIIRENVHEMRSTEITIVATITTVRPMGDFGPTPIPEDKP